MHPKVLITGYAGQLGTYLSRILSGPESVVHGVCRQGIVKDLFTGQVVTSCDLLRSDDVDRLLIKEQYTVIYNLAALSSVGQSWQRPLDTFHVNTTIVVNLLETARKYDAELRIFQASSADAYACAESDFIGEKTSIKPGSPYGISKAAAGMFIDLYREKFNVQAINGILFANESPMRNENFVTMKIIKFLVKYSVKREGCLELGNIEIERDFGFSGEYAKIIKKIMEAPTLKNVVIATGHRITLKKFIEIACLELKIKLRWHGEGSSLRALDSLTEKTFICISEKYFRPDENALPQADISVLKDFYHLEPTIFSSELVKILIGEESQLHV